uniref:NADH:quinone oxidoreductase/Mrp antiporter membrane subunit domain-containing protein n=1 Tax=Solanum lycopersicum TaxID=4081 RepID=K4D1J2_SOLLC
MVRVKFEDTRRNASYMLKTCKSTVYEKYVLKFCSSFLSSWSSFVAGYFVRFLGKEGTALITTSPTVVMLIVVKFISSFVNIYSISYMYEDLHSPQFMCYLSIPTFFMPMFPTGDNFLQLLLRWEGVGIASYLLIHCWLHDLGSHTWSPNAMVVPTLVSALIHATTMVITGVFMIGKNAYTKYTISGNFDFWLGSVSVLFTSYYSFRYLFLTFLVPNNSFGQDILRCHYTPIPLAIPLTFLAHESLFVGYLGKV